MSSLLKSRQALLRINSAAESCQKRLASGSKKALPFKPPTMNDLPVPEGSWQHLYAARQRKYNLHLLAGLGVLGVTVFAGWQSGAFFLGFSPDKKVHKVVATYNEPASAEVAEPVTEEPEVIAEETPVVEEVPVADTPAPVEAAPEAPVAEPVAPEAQEASVPVEAAVETVPEPEVAPVAEPVPVPVVEPVQEPAVEAVAPVAVEEALEALAAAVTLVEAVMEEVVSAVSGPEVNAEIAEAVVDSAAHDLVVGSAPASAEGTSEVIPDGAAAAIESPADVVEHAPVTEEISKELSPPADIVGSAVMETVISEAPVILAEDLTPIEPANVVEPATEVEVASADPEPNAQSFGQEETASPGSSVLPVAVSEVVKEVAEEPKPLAAAAEPVLEEAGAPVEAQIADAIETIVPAPEAESVVQESVESSDK